MISRITRSNSSLRSIVNFTNCISRDVEKYYLLASSLDSYLELGGADEERQRGYSAAARIRGNKTYCCDAMCEWDTSAAQENFYVSTVITFNCANGTVTSTIEN